MEDKLLTIDELSDKLQVSKATLYRWAATGYMPCLKLGGSLRFRMTSVQKWLQKREQPGRYRRHIDVDSFRGINTGAFGSKNLNKSD